MAYKFQLGEAKLSGSITQTDGTITALGLDNSDANATSFGDIELDSLSSAGGSIIEATDNVRLSGTVALQFANADTKIGSDGGGNLQIEVTGTTKALSFIQGATTNFAIKDELNESQVNLRMSGSKLIEFGSATETLGIDVGSGDLLLSGAANVSLEADTLVMKADSVIDVQSALSSSTFISASNIVLQDATTLADEGLSDASGKLALDIGSMLGAVTSTGDVDDTDELAISDNGTTKKIDFSVLRDAGFSAVSGDATIAAGGALTIANDAVTNDKLANITRGYIKVGGAANAPTDLDAKTSGYILVGDGTDIASVAVSGDIALASNGAVTIQANAVEGSMLSSSVAGTGLEYSSNALNVSASQTVITDIFNSSLVIGTAYNQEYIDFSTSDQIHLVVNDTPVARVIDGTFIVDGNLHVSGTTTSVDSTTINISSSFTFEGPVDPHQTILHAGTPTADSTVYLPTLDAGSYYLPVLANAPDAASSLVTAAEFALLDGAATVGTTEVTGSDGFLHNDNGTMRQTEILKISEYSLGRVGGDATINASNGELTIANDAVQAVMLNDDCISGFDDIGAAIVGTDELLISDAGVLKRTDMSRVATYIGDNVSTTVQALSGAAESLDVSLGQIVIADRASAMTITLDTPANHDGKRIVIKRIGDGEVTISPNGSENIDGQAADIVLESPFAAVTIFSDGSDYFVV